MQDHVDILGIIGAFARTWRSWLAGSVVVGVAAILYSTHMVPVEFRSAAIVLPPGGGGGGGFMGLMGGLGAPTDFEIDAIDGRELLTLLGTRSIRVALIDEFDLLERYGTGTIHQGLRALGNHLLIEEEIAGGLASVSIVSVKISVWDEDPELAASMANWIVDEANRRIEEVSLAKVTWDESFIATHLDEAREQSRQRQGELEAFALETGIFSLQEQLGEIAGLLAEQQALITALQMEEEVASTHYSPEHPIRRGLGRRIAAARSTVSELRSKGFDGLVPALDSIPEKQRVYFELYLDARIAGALIEQLTPRLEMVRIQRSYDRPRLRLLQRAVPSDYKDRPSRAWIVLGICVVYQLLWFTWFFARERIHTIRETDPDRFARMRAILRSFSRAPAA